MKYLLLGAVLALLGMLIETMSLPIHPQLKYPQPMSAGWSSPEFYYTPMPSLSTANFSSK